MTRIDFIDYLVQNGAEIVRIANQGYHVMRKEGKMSGVPTTDPPLNATVCRICRTLEVEIPDVARDASTLIDHIQDRFNGEGKE